MLMLENHHTTGPDVICHCSDCVTKAQAQHRTLDHFFSLGYHTT